ncbi:RDD family protein [Sediminivirga luteola]|uniref:Membrane protein n=1 Tax=Sediminivirga luteola TaxID=1774748 RepID=A0A8J2TYU5_9MICO|nr:RDD family protein [Sediminivirga luteola]GGA18450.1 membrane protein [Sediminivirga luteola]
MSTIMTGEAVPLQLRPAALIARAGSCAIDFVAIQGLWLVLFFSANWLLERSADWNMMLATSLALMLQVFCAVLIPATVETLTRGRSLGKFVLGLRVVRDDGGAIRFRHAFLRAMLWVFEVLAMGGALAALVGLVSPQSKRIGDYLAGTMAVAERTPRAASRHVVMPPRLAAWARLADISAIPPGLSHRVLQFLTSAPRMRPEARLHMAIQLADEVTPYTAPAPPAGTHPEEFLAAVSASIREREIERRSRAERIGAGFRARTSRLPHGL